jgi:protein disulfide-isomerase
MKKILLVFLSCLAAGQVFADTTWLTSVPDALAKAKREHKLVLLDFTGSDWCVWCKKLDADTFSQPLFAAYAGRNLELVEVDFPAQKPQPDALKQANTALQSKYSVDGYPTLVLLDANGKLLWKQVGYVEGGPKALIALINKAKT